MKRLFSPAMVVIALFLTSTMPVRGQDDDIEFDDNPQLETRVDKVDDHVDPAAVEEFEKLFVEEENAQLATFALPRLPEEQPSKNGLSFRESDDGEGVVLASVTNSDREIEVPAEYAGKPVVGLGNVAFSGCENLRKVTFPESLRKIGNFVFIECRNLEEVSIPAGVTEIAPGLFHQSPKVKLAGTFDANPVFGGLDLSQCDDSPDARGFLWYERQEDHIVIRGFAGEPRELRIPDEIDGKPVTKIGQEAFSCCYTLKSVVIPKTVVRIGEAAFQGCGLLESAPLPRDVVEIGNKAFGACYSLDVKETFRETSGFGVVTIDELTGKSGTRGFIWYEAVDDDSIVIRGCTTDGVTLNIPDKIDGFQVVALGDEAFFLNPALVSVTIPEGVTSIGKFCFKSSEYLTSVKLPSTLKRIDEQGFSFCTALKRIEIPASVETIGRAAFINCGSLNFCEAFRKSERFGACRYDEFSAGGPVDGYVLYEKRDDGVVILGGYGRVLAGFYGFGPQKMRIPDRIEGIPVVEIGPDAFNLNFNLRELAIPDSVTRVAQGAFYFSRSLTRVHLPANLTALEDGAFSQSSKLNLQLLPPGVTEWGGAVFHEDVLLRAPRDSATAKTLLDAGYHEVR